MPNGDFLQVQQSQAQYYGGLLDTHGTGSIDSVASGRDIYKALRYAKVCELIPLGAKSIHDVGFGLGHFYDHLGGRQEFADVEYSGSEVTPQFVEYCRNRFPKSKFFLRDLAAQVPDERYDCVVLTGTFYHRREISEEQFMAFTEAILRSCFEITRLAMVFNFVSPFVEYRVGDLFYPDFDRIMSLVRSMSRFSALNSASPLFEHTIAVYREDYISTQFADEAFDRYFVERRNVT